MLRDTEPECFASLVDVSAALEMLRHPWGCFGSGGNALASLGMLQQRWKCFGILRDASAGFGTLSAAGWSVERPGASTISRRNAWYRFEPRDTAGNATQFPSWDANGWAPGLRSNWNYIQHFFSSSGFGATRVLGELNTLLTYSMAISYLTF